MPPSAGYHKQCHSERLMHAPLWPVWGFFWDVYPIMGLRNNSLLNCLPSTILATEIFLKCKCVYTLTPLCLAPPPSLPIPVSLSSPGLSYLPRPSSHSLCKGCWEHFFLPCPSVSPPHLQISLNAPNPSMTVPQSKCRPPGIVTIIHLFVS